MATKSGYTGVYERFSQWVVHIRVGKRNTRRGPFAYKDEAVQARAILKQYVVEGKGDQLPTTEELRQIVEQIGIEKLTGEELRVENRRQKLMRNM